MGKVDAYAAVWQALNTEGLAVSNSEMLTELVYPNPVSNALQFTSFIKNGEAELIDMNGRRTPLQIIDNSIDVSTIAPGVYVLRLYSAGKWTQTRVVISR
jgi:hypothetical protein